MNAVMKRSLLAKYLITNLSLAVLACAVVGLILFSFSIAQLNHAYEQEQMNRLAIAADDLQRQEKVMSEDALEIRFDELYRPAWFGRDATYELEMTKSLEKYKGSSPLIDQFFILYRGTDNVYYPNRKNYFPIHMAQLGIAGDIEGLYQQFVSVTDKGLVIHDDGHAFLCYNLPMSKKRNIGDAVLVYCIDRNILLGRLETTMGLRADSLYVYYAGHLISADDGPDIEELVFNGGNYQDSQYLAAQSTGGMFVVLMPVSANASYAVLDQFRVVCLWIFGGFSVIMLLMAWLTAYRNWRPIGKLLRHYLPNSQHGNNELEQINRLLSSSMESREKAQNTLMRQMESIEAQRLQIRRQLLLLILSGSWDISPQETITSGSLPLPMPGYGLVVLRLSVTSDVDALCRMIEELSGEDMLFYATPLQDTQSIVVLVNLEEKAQLAVAMELIEGVRDAFDIAFDLLPGEACDRVDELPGALVRILTQGAKTAGHFDDSMNSEKATERVMELIRAGQTADALFQLESLLAALPTAYPSLMIRRYFCASIYNLLIETAHQEGIFINPQRSVPLSIATSEAEMHRSVLALGREICAQRESKEDEQGDVQELVDMNTLHYIDEHLLDWSLTLDSVGEAIGVSTRQISRILRRSKNMTYKEYVTTMRMERAKDLLTRESLSVSETSERVCYANVSYFIKTFRQYVGMTPANYKLFTKCGTDEA